MAVRRGRGRRTVLDSRIGHPGLKGLATHADYASPALAATGRGHPPERIRTSAGDHSLRLKSSPDVRIRVEAGIATIRIDPDQGTFHDFLEQEVVPLGRDGLTRFVDSLCQESQTRPSSLCADQTLAVLVPLVSEERVRAIFSSISGTNKNTESRGKFFARPIIQKSLAAIGAFGANAAPAVPHLTPC